MGEARTANVSEGPLIPKPPATVSALRQAVAQVAPIAVPAFTRELDQAVDQAGAGADLAPLRRFTAHWAAYVEIQRHPSVAARFSELEAIVAEGGEERVRAAASEIGRILDDAYAATLKAGQ
ncbi:DUF6247 family protein [Streptomyces sp. T-3]|nr:DUF6247 family protein [Streptomyces sp. T-3]